MDAEVDRLKRWRLVLGEDAQAAGVAADDSILEVALSDDELAIDRVLTAIYGSEATRGAGLGKSAPKVHRWLGDIRSYFPQSVVRVLQKDALERLGLKRLLLEPEMLSAVEADVHLVATLLSLSKAIPKKTRETARQVVRKLVREVEERLKHKLLRAVAGGLDRSARTRRPKHADIDWHRTIRLNLKTYQPQLKTVIPERLIGFGRRRNAMKDVVLCVDQSASMAESVVYAGILGAVLASIPALKTSFVAFDTEIADLTQKLSDPVEVLFGTQLGGGTDIARAVGYCEGLVSRPTDTTLILITDLFEGGDAAELLARLNRFHQAGVLVICLLALADSGTPAFDHEMAARVADLGIATFGATPELFPDLLAAALARRDFSAFCARAKN